MFSISHPKRFYLSLLLGISGLAFFLLFSRIPQLNAKASFNFQNILDGIISHELLLYIEKDDSLIVNFLKNTANWLYANYRGMLFGLFLGGCAKNLFRYLKIFPKNNLFVHAFAGLWAGMPLGVCVNCAAPIMKGILFSRKKAFALSMMTSSPSMNFIVLSMLFATLPMYLALLKLLFNCIIILLVIPLILLKTPEHANTQGLSEGNFRRETETWRQGFTEGIKELLADLKFIFQKTGPLMLLAAIFVGMLVLAMQNIYFLNISGNIFTLCLVSLIGILLPVPIAVDILLASAFFFMGVDISIVLVFLCTLGISSIYSLAIVWRSLSAFTAISLFFSIFFLSLIISPLGKITEDIYRKKNLQYYSELIQKLPTVPEEKKRTVFQSTSIAAEKILYKPIGRQGNFSLYAAPFTKQRESHSQRLLKLEGDSIGLVKGYEPSNIDFNYPLWAGRGIAAGDIDGDGWEDLVLGSNEGPWVYRNIGGKFLLEPHNLEPLITFFLALIDLNNDGFPELFFTTYMKGNRLVPNINGKLRFDLMKKIPNGNALLTATAAFADFDGNGYLDIVNGNTISIDSLTMKKIPEKRLNTIVFNDGTSFKEYPLKAFPEGDTLTALVGDFNGDSLPDIIFGNDFNIPDSFHLNKGKGRFELASLTSVGINRIPMYSMSYNIADLNNDLFEDFFLSGTIVHPKSQNNYETSPKYTNEKWEESACSKIKNISKAIRCREIIQLRKYSGERTSFTPKLKNCLNLKENLQKACLSNILLQMSLLTRSLSSFFPHCNLFPHKYDVLRKTCLLRKENDTNRVDLRMEMSLIMPKEENSHYMYKGIPGGFTEIPQKQKGQIIFPKVTGWSWNSLIFDLDNDGFQDIFLVNGSMITSANGPNYFLKNNGVKFIKKTFEFGLDSEFNYYSFVPIDFDNDGDLDIIVNSAEGPIRVYKNNHAAKNSLSIRFLSKGRNFNSTKVILKSGKKHWMRKVQHSGGYLSSPSNRLYFGLGGKGEFSASIILPSKKKIDLAFKLKSGFQYLIVEK